MPVPGQSDAKFVVHSTVNCWNHFLIGKCQQAPLKRCLYHAAGLVNSSIMSTLSLAFTSMHVMFTLAAVPRSSAEAYAHVMRLACLFCHM